MFSFFYDLLLIVLSLLALPKLVWGIVRYGKYKKSLAGRFGIGLPTMKKQLGSPIIWIHAVSMGETKAAAPLFRSIKETYPNAQILVSSTTETGQAEAQRCLPGAHHYFYLPFDFSWVIKRVIKKLHPDVLILVESDFWYHLLKYAKKNGAVVLLANGKISERSANRFTKFQFLTRRLFGQFDRLCIQSRHYADRFLRMGIPEDKLAVTGNLKLDHIPNILNEAEKNQLKTELSIQKGDKIIVVGSTHDPEEEWIFSALKQLRAHIPQLKLIVVPRHPERFNWVTEQLRAHGASCMKYSERENMQGDTIVIDRMGLLTACYQIADVAIVAGSFTDRVGGHNIFEPIQCGVPTLFGPYMHSQPELCELVLGAKAAQQTSLAAMPEILLDLLQNPKAHQQYSTAANALANQMQGAAKRTFAEIATFLTSKVEVKSTVC